jgi:hypothetical protein
MGRTAPRRRADRLTGRALVGALLAWATLQPARTDGLGGWIGLELAFSADLRPVPDWLKPLQLRTRAGYLNQFQNDTLASTAEYRLYFNYGFTFSLKQKTRPEGRVFSNDSNDDSSDADQRL